MRAVWPWVAFVATVLSAALIVWLSRALTRLEQRVQRLEQVAASSRVRFQHEPDRHPGDAQFLAAWAQLRRARDAADRREDNPGG